MIILYLTTSGPSISVSKKTKKGIFNPLHLAGLFVNEQLIISVKVLVIQKGNVLIYLRSKK